MQQKFMLIASYPDSIVNFRGQLIKDLIAEGLEVHVAVPNLLPESTIRQKLESMGVQVHEYRLSRTGLNPFSDFFALYRLWRLMVRVRPDFILAYTIKPVIYGCWAAWLAGVNKRYALITGLGYAFQEFGYRRKWLKQIVRIMYRNALEKTHKIFFQNPDDKELFLSMGIIKQDEPKAVVVRGSGVDLEHFKVMPIPDKPYFLLIARLLIDKGVREYVEAAKRVRDKYPDVQFGLVGWIDENPNAISDEELNKWIVNGDIEFLGRLEDVRSAIARCSTYVLPSYREGTPRTVLEAMAMGRPIITTDAPGCRETVIDGVNGFLVPVKSVTALESVMIRLIEEPLLVEQMGKRSRQLAEELYDVRKVNAQMLSEMGLRC